MQDNRTSKRVKLAVILCAAALGAYVPLTHTGASVAQGPPAKTLEIVGRVPFDQRTGMDDGAVLAVHFSGDTHGSLETCG